VAASMLAGFDGEGSVLVVLADGEESCAKSFRNIAGVSVLHVEQVGVADVVGSGRMIVSEAALGRLTEKAVAK
jgi:large subunit ribosomal protein L4